jgi:hypothetical protein
MKNPANKDNREGKSPPDGEGGERLKLPKPGKVISSEEAMKTASFLTGPIQRKKSHFEILTVPAGGKISVIALTPVEILETHWFGNRSHPHYNLPAKCEGCELDAEIRLKAFFLARHTSANRNFLVELSENALLSVPQCQDVDGWVKHLITITRRGPKPNGRLFAKVQEVPAAFAGLVVPPLDIKPAILALFLPGQKAWETRRLINASQVLPLKEEK